MLMAELVRLDTAWSPRPQLKRRAIWRGNWPRCASRDPLLAGGAGPLVSAAAIASPSLRVASQAGAGRRERAVGLTPQHRVDEPAGQQLLDPAQPHEPRRGEVVVAEAPIPVGGCQLVDPGPDVPGELQLGERLVELG